MMPAAALRSLAIERFRNALARQLGLQFDDTKLSFLEEVLRKRLDARDREEGAYLEQLERAPEDAEVGALAEQLTVPETYFFRNNDQFRALVEVCLPQRMKIQEAAGRKRLRFLSAGCASGEEPYSLAILLRESLGPMLPSWDLAITGVDLNPAVLERAARARYSQWALRETDTSARARWFHQEGRDFVLAAEVREMVQFQRRNLTEDDPSFWQADSADVIFCRNVLMYLTVEAAQAVVARIARTLMPGGFLFLGHAETLRGLSTEFHLCHTQGTFYYQLKVDQPTASGGEIWERELSRPMSSSRPPTPSANGADATQLVATVDTANSWVEVIRRASERIQTLTESGSGRRAHTHGDHGSSRPPDTESAPRSSRDGDNAGANIGVGLELLRDERFVDALAFVRSLPAETASAPEALLLHAVLLTHSGRLTEAETVCAELLRIDDLDAGAHYVLALCRESGGDARGAEENDRLAAYLDPTFAMPRLHLGLLARRRGDLASARRELTHALELLQREDAARVLLFGGGFRREALVTLCRAELGASGGPP